MANTGPEVGRGGEGGGRRGEVGGGGLGAWARGDTTMVREVGGGPSKEERRPVGGLFSGKKQHQRGGSNTVWVGQGGERVGQGEESERARA